MIWLTWRQHRREVMAAGLLLALVALLLVLTESWESSAVTASQLACGPNGSGREFCGASTSLLSIGISLKYLVMALPALLGVFVGAPLIAREIEQGTHVFAWTQSLTRRRWFTIKVAILGTLSLAGAVAVSLLAGWWHQPFDVVVGSGAWVFFDAFGAAPVAYALFALALGIAVSAAIRRTVPAMAITLFAFVVVRVGISAIRPWFMPPVVKETDFASSYPFPSGALTMDEYWTDPSHHRLSDTQFFELLQRHFPGSIGVAAPGGATPIQNSQAISQWFHDQGYQFFVVFQPADRFWTFQTIETALFLIPAAMLVAMAFWLLRHHVR